MSIADGTLDVALVGSKFMGRAHSHAWRSVGAFFDLPLRPVLHTVVARDPAALAEFAQRWGWRNTTTDYASVLADPAVDLVDIGTPNNLHAEQAIGALEAGKHVACEKPLADTLESARAMAAAARTAPGSTFVWYSYRRVPAVALARALVRRGLVGPVHHVRAVYAQSWGGAASPALWRFDAATAGTGAHGDINAHIIDAVRFVTGEEITHIAGAISKTFVPGRTVDDAVLFIAQLSGGGVASFEATRLATGYHNHNGFEIHGERGALRYYFDRMTQLDVFDATGDLTTRGWTSIDVSDADAGHPYAQAWWPAGHHIGYEHTFTNQAADIVAVLGGEAPVAPIADFADALVTQTVLAAVLRSAERGTGVDVAELAEPA